MKHIKDQFIIYNKQERKFIHIEDTGITDDFNGGPNVKPNLGGVKNNLVASIWPYELKDYVNENRNSGKISQKLIELSDKIDTEDNPILILVHLKQKSMHN